MPEHNDVELTPEEQKIEGALQVVTEKEHALIKVGEAQLPVPTLKSTEEELDGFNRFLARTQLGGIERKKQRKMRQILADAEVDVLRARTEAVVQAHNGLTKAALQEIILVAREYGLASLRESELREQLSIQRAVVRAAIQYSDFLATLPTDLAEGVLDTVQKNASEIFSNTLEKIRNASFNPK